MLSKATAGQGVEMTRFGIVAMTSLGLVLLTSVSAAAAIKIASIQYDSPGTDDGSNASLNREFVVIEITGNRRVALEGFTLRDRSGHVYTFDTFRLRPGRSVTVHTGRGSDDRNDVYWDAGEYVWNNDGDTAILRNESERRIDRCPYSGGGTSIAC